MPQLDKANCFSSIKLYSSFNLCLQYAPAWWCCKIKGSLVLYSHSFLKSRLLLQFAGYYFSRDYLLISILYEKSTLWDTPGLGSFWVLLLTSWSVMIIIEHVKCHCVASMQGTPDTHPPQRNTAKLKESLSLSNIFNIERTNFNIELKL